MVDNSCCIRYVWKCYSVSHGQLFVTPWTIARQASLSMGILQTRILEWVAMSSSRGSSQPRDKTQISHIAGGFFTIWATREALWTTKEQLDKCWYICSHVISSIPAGASSKELACQCRRHKTIPGLRRSPGVRSGNPLQYSCLENPHRQRSLAGCSHSVAKS